MNNINVFLGQDKEGLPFFPTWCGPSDDGTGNACGKCRFDKKMDNFRNAVDELTKDEIINDYKQKKRDAISHFLEVWACATKMEPKPKSDAQTDAPFENLPNRSTHFRNNEEIHEFFYNEEYVFFAKSLNVSHTYSRYKSLNLYSSTGSNTLVSAEDSVTP